ncbi:PREDICTED: uncharacterized protein LOC109183382 [Ipomoea nil]|uniref:uncharacterized protein LOC109183382 n=1 Tax=Ipomoea nil TaxID=35883 RepID=UPI000901F807|nr:PREDICTED: uncharacterized protein LOC109183382 [Ipomoea nil]
MSVLSWNCRGLGGPRTVRELLDLVSKKRPDFVFLMETKSCSIRLESVRVRLGFEGLLCVDRVGMGGGLTLFWREKEMASLLSFSDNNIDVEVTLPGMAPWRLTGFYGHPERSRICQSWDLLRTFSTRSDLPWAVIGDINDLANHAEKKGPIPHPDSLVRGFNEVLQECDLSDLGMSGYEFTWEKGRGTEHWIEERLDRAVASTAWCNTYLATSVQNILTLNSDHSAIILRLEDSLLRRGNRCFKFESAWILDEECRRVGEHSWDFSRNLDFRQCVERCGNDL